MKKFLCLSVADIHGNKSQYEKIKRLVKKENISFVFMCGDLLPKDGGSWTIDNKIRTIEMQREFIDEYFIDYLSSLGKLTNVYAIFGNDDFMSNYSYLAQAKIDNVKFLNSETEPLLSPAQGLFVAGYPYIGMTPFFHKDWERWDDKPGSTPHKIYRSDGYCSENGKHIKADLKDSDLTIKKDLEDLAKHSDPKKTIYIFHEAPLDTPLDMIAPDNKYIKEDILNIGSKAVREFIISKKPLLTMHGHIHETFDQSGDFKWQTGDSVSITAANDFTSNKLSCVLFSLPKLELIKRLTV